jgi:hypothetical protein
MSCLILFIPIKSMSCLILFIPIKSMSTLKDRIQRYDDNVENGFQNKL